MAKRFRCRNCIYYKPSKKFADTKYCLAEAPRLVNSKYKCIYFESI